MPRRIVLLVAFWSGAASLAKAETELTPREFDSLRQLIRPQADESLWAAIPWRINLKEAREQAAREDKPLLLWRSGGGDVLGRT